MSSQLSRKIDSSIYDKVMTIIDKGKAKLILKKPNNAGSVRRRVLCPMKSENLSVLTKQYTVL